MVTESSQFPPSPGLPALSRGPARRREDYAGDSLGGRTHRSSGREPSQFDATRCYLDEIGASRGSPRKKSFSWPGGWTGCGGASGAGCSRRLL